MKHLFLLLLTVVTIGGAVSLFTGCKKAGTDAAAAQYTCSMHPEVVTNAPGKCPKCSMDLKPKT